MYTRIIFNVDFENWEIQKCNPKYIFYSGYIKKNPNSGPLKSTSDNFSDCIRKFNNKENGEFSQLLEKKK